VTGTEEYRTLEVATDVKCLARFISHKCYGDIRKNRFTVSDRLIKLEAENVIPIL